MVDIRLKEVYVNLKNYNFDTLGSYKMDENEALKLIGAIEDLEKCWMSCKEILPEKSGFYLVSTKDDITVMQWLKHSKKWISRELGECNLYVKAWKELPKRYIEKEVEENENNKA